MSKTYTLELSEDEAVALVDLFYIVTRSPMAPFEHAMCTLADQVGGLSKYRFIYAPIGMSQTLDLGDRLYSQSLRIERIANA